MLVTSGLGAKAPAMTKIPRIAYRTFRHIQPALTTPINARKNTRMGISKMMPNPMMIVRNKSVYSPIVIIG